ncbi:MAG: hypothetical protein GY870_02310 [archaeon]|nr:hypothetical protein [archaeon]
MFYFQFSKNNPSIINSLQDPFILNNGTRVITSEEWSERREEIKTLLLNEEYGQMPDRPDAINATKLSTKTLENGSTLNILTLSLVPSNETPSIEINFTIWVFIPSGVGPFPAIIKVSPDGTGSQTIINQTITDRGYIFVCYNHTELDPDSGGEDIVGTCQQAYPGYSWGSLSVWSWGAMRVADYILGEVWVNAPDGFPSVDPDKLIITGHSRRGKTAFLAGALDERFDMVVPNGSGCGGAGSFLVQSAICENIAFITSDFGFKTWFHQNFSKYANNEIALSFDQHFLRALVAPRIILSTDALDDFWSNPTGTYAIYNASNPVFEFLGVEENNAIHFRAGGHAFTAEDFAVILNFADKMLLNKDISGEFYVTPFTFDVPYDYTTP